MAGGKETPRQKMIGLMYLVLTAMLALNVSKQILQGYLSVNESLEKSKKNIEENNNRVTEAFKGSVLLNKGAAPYYEQALLAQKELQETYKYIQDVKGNLIKATLKLETPVNADTVNLRHAPQSDKIDDYDTPTTLLLGSDEHNLKKGPLTADELRTKLNALHDKLIAQLDKMQKTEGQHLLVDDYNNLKKKIAIIKPTDSNREEDGVKFTWPMDNFYHLPMAAVYVNLNKMQGDIKNVEAEILQVFSGASGKLTLKFDQLRARVIANSSYVQVGQPYEADIFIGASSSKISAEDMKIYLGVDSAGAASGAKGEEVQIVNGEGKLKRMAGAEGDQTYKGVIVYKNPDGTFKYYPFEQSYKVAKAAATVSADQMNVFYAGVPNPVTASAAGISPSDLQVTATGGGVRMTPKGAGKFDFNFSSPGECMITVSAKTKDGVKAQGPPIKFRVKPLPKPELKIGGKYAPQELKRGELALAGGLGAGANGFDFQANFVVKSYEVVGKVKGKLQSAAGNSNNLAADAKAILAGADVGTKVYIDAKIQGPDGKTTSVTCGIKVAR